MKRKTVRIIVGMLSYPIKRACFALSGRRKYYALLSLKASEREKEKAFYRGFYLASLTNTDIRL